MNRQEVKNLLPILQAFAEDKVIETRTNPKSITNPSIPNDWTEMKELEYWANTEYRIKPSPTYRPFANAEECWKEMLKHQPFGWVKSGDWFCVIEQIRPTCIFWKGCGDVFHFEDMVKKVTFADGSAFGVKVDE